MERVNAPWTHAQVRHLQMWQKSPYVHSFTCPHRGDTHHRDCYGDHGGLRPTLNGWECMDCDYTQNWAHDIMVEFDEASFRPSWATQDTWTITLNRYQRNNLLYMLNSMGYPYGNPYTIPDIPMSYNTGDWFGEIANMLGGILEGGEPYNGKPIY